MNRSVLKSGLLTLLFSLASVAPAGAQVLFPYYYPPGYGAYGWGGWGGSLEGSTAAGLGYFAAMAGQYNVDTAQANAVNAQTTAAWNDYVYQCTQQHLRTYYANQARQAQQQDEAWTELRDRKLNNPTDSDIFSGDTLNALYHVITNPKIYGKTIAAASRPFPGTVVRNIPFNYAAGAFTYSLGELISRDNVPAIFGDAKFTPLRQELRDLAAQLRKEAAESGKPDPETLKKVRADLTSAREILQRLTAEGSKERKEGENYLKAALGVTRMLESPSYDVYLAAAGKQPAVQLGEVLKFMHAFNLRFGAAKTPAQRELYSQLYAVMSDLRKAVEAPTAEAFAAAETGPKRDNRAPNFFAGMDYKTLQPPSASPPPAPARP